MKNSYWYGYKDGKIDGYNKAIDDFEEQLRVHYAIYRDRGFVSDTSENIIRNVFEYAEMLRVQNKIKKDKKS